MLCRCAPPLCLSLSAWRAVRPGAAPGMPALPAQRLSGCCLPGLACVSLHGLPFRHHWLTDRLFTLLSGLQEKGLDTVDANRALGLPDDCREYSAVSQHPTPRLSLGMQCMHAPVPAHPAARAAYLSAFSAGEGTFLHMLSVCTLGWAHTTHPIHPHPTTPLLTPAAAPTLLLLLLRLRLPPCLPAAGAAHPC
jgi:hypothetical protein